MSTNTISYTPGTDPEKELRSDLWPTMTLAELQHQQDLAITKLANFAKIIGPTSPPSYLMVYNALQAALDQLNALVDIRSQQGKKG